MTFRRFIFTAGAMVCAAAMLADLRRAATGVASVDFLFAVVFLKRGWV